MKIKLEMSLRVDGIDLTETTAVETAIRDAINNPQLLEKWLPGRKPEDVNVCITFTMP